MSRPTDNQLKGMMAVIWALLSILGFMFFMLGIWDMFQEPIWIKANALIDFMLITVGAIIFAKGLFKTHQYLTMP